MTAAEAVVKRGGVIIMLAESGDGTGGDSFYHMIADKKDIFETMSEIIARDRLETEPDQWEAQILIRILMRAHVIYVSAMPDEVIENMHMIPEHSLSSAVKAAKSLLGKDCAGITAIPDGIAVMVKGRT